NLILDRTQVLDGLLKNLINIVEVIEGDISVSKIDFQALTGSVIEEIKKERNIDKVDLKINIKTEKPFYNDSNLIYTVLFNLLDNSFKYQKENRENSFIKLKITDYINKNILIEIKDNGIGI